MLMEEAAPSDPLYHNVAMHRALTAVTLVTLVGCASSTQQRMLKVAVFEQRGRYRAPSVQGQHAFMVALTNQSEEAVWVDSISLRPQTNQLQFSEGDQVVNDVLEPQETKDFTLFVNVMTTANSYIYSIESVDVVVTCHTSARGSFTETTPQSVTPVD
jgi:hypothetical protein